MSARFLLGFFDSVYVIALTAWVGSILFFSFAVAPVIFTVLGPEAGGRFVRALFPRYYAWGAIAGAVALPAYVAVPLCYPEYRGPDRRHPGDDPPGLHPGDALRGQLADTGDQRRPRRRARGSRSGSIGCIGGRSGSMPWSWWPESAS